ARPDDVSAVGRLDAGQDAQQRRLAGAVLADQAETLAGGSGQIDPGQHRPIAVGLGDVARAKHRPGNCGRHTYHPDSGWMTWRATAGARVRTWSRLSMTS